MLALGGLLISGCWLTLLISPQSIDSETIGATGALLTLIVFSVLAYVMYRAETRRRLIELPEANSVIDFNEIIVESTDLGICIIDDNGKILRCNHAMANMVQQKQDALEGMHYAELFPQTMREWLCQIQLNRISAKGMDGALSLQLIRPNDAPLEVSLRVIHSVGDAEASPSVLCFTDTSQQKALMDATAEAERIANFGHWSFELEPQKIWWSRQIYRMFGIEHLSEPPAFETHHEFFVKEDWEALQVCLNEARQKGQPYAIELRFFHSSGEQRVMMAKGNPLRDNDDVIVRIVGTVQDITEIKRSENRLKESTQRLKSLFQYSPVALFRVLPDDAFTVLFVSDKVEAITGYPAEDFLTGQITFGEIIHPEDATRMSVSLSDLHDKDDREYDFEYRIIHADGSVHWVYEHGALSEDTGVPGGYVLDGILLDITQRKEVEAKLELINERMKLANNAVGIGVWDYLFDSDTLTWDSNMFKLYEVDRDQFQGNFEDWLRCVHEDDVDEAKAAFYSAVNNDELFDSIFRINLDSGKTRYVRACARTYKKADGSPERAIGTNWDVTASMLVDEQLRKSRDEAEKAAKAKSSFLAAMSHEIRTPMNGVIGMTHVLEETQLTEEQQDYLNIIKTSGDTLLTIINDILDFSKIEAGKLTLERIPFNLRNAIEQTMEILAPQAHKKGLEMAFMVADETPQKVIGDVTRLRQILLNLLSNAIKFTEEGEVFLEVESSKPSNDNNVQLRFVVRDTGIGIPADKHDLLFQSFMQMSDATTRRYGGTGLGLAICKRLVESMQGEIWINPEVTKGSEFHFTITVPIASPRISISPKAPKHQLKGKRMLIVDDNPTDCRLLSLQAHAWDMQVTVVNDADSALEVLKDAQTFDVAIIDYRIPGMDGIKLGKAIHDLAPYHDLPLVLMSSKANLQATNDFFVYFQKPLPMNELQEIISREISQGSAQKVTHAVKTKRRRKRTNPEDLSAMRVLLAEDNRVNQRVTLLMLDRLGYQADVVNNGQEALDALEQADYDVLLLDVQMPVLDGYQTARRIMETIPEEKTPHVIAITAMAMEGDRERSLESGMHDYVSKPIDMTSLELALENAAQTLSERIKSL